MNGRPTASTITDAELDALHATIDRVRALEARLWQVDEQRTEAVSAVCHSMANDLRCALGEDTAAALPSTAEDALTRVRKTLDSVKAAGQGHTPSTRYDRGVADGVDWVTRRVLEAIDARLVHEPADLTPCTGFPDSCPNPVDVPALSPYHGGGVRCGCGDQPKEN
ncbi:hypothetical protein [Streptomyces sp. NPDC001492]